MADLSIIAANKAGDYLFALATALARPVSPLKLALFTTMPDSQTGTGGVEVVGNAYARATVVFSTFASGASSNNADVTFPAATGAGWVNVVGVAVYDSTGTPIMLLTGTFPSTIAVTAGQTFKVVQGALVIILD